ncbi:MAG: hypothetical protein M1825_005378 [Sarcosagium campestre]|nr:MAG: hypothetical protein M1825_005378 [Sarcosagium campestre]
MTLNIIVAWTVLLALVEGNLGYDPSKTPASTTKAQAQMSGTSTTSPSPTNTGSGGGGGGPTSSPLLFFVALGFGVVFTNLWIIVGVKYCFRYNQRNRQPRPDEAGDPIDLATMRRPGRRRREKKLMTMDEVNDRFPLIKYKAWRSSREREGLPAAAGVAAPPSRPASRADSRPASLRDIDPLRRMSTDERSSTDAVRPATSASTRETAAGAVPDAITPSPPKPTVEDAVETEPQRNSKVTETKDNVPTEAAAGANLERTRTTASTVGDKDRASTNEDDDDEEDDHIHTAVPPEMLSQPGDTCAICIDTIEDDDDVRGLSCGHAFHASCLDPWLTSRRACCPLCKADYYIPKPRPEGEAATAELERHGRRTAANHGAPLPAVPASAWSGGRSGAAFSPRGLMHARFITAIHADHDRYGFPMPPRNGRRQRSQPSGPTDTSYTADIEAGAPAQHHGAARDWRQIMHTFRRDRSAADPAAPPPPETSFTADPSPATTTNQAESAGNGWRSRFSTPLRSIRLPGRRQASSGDESNDPAHPSPSQLEAATGTRATAST